MLRVIVPASQHTETFEFNGKTYGRQEAAVHLGGHFPAPFFVNTPVDKPYPKGEYTLDPRSLGVTERGKLVINTVRLLPLSGSSAK